MTELGFGTDAGDKVLETAAEKKTVVITIDEQEGYPNYVALGHNGDQIQVQRGVDVEVDAKFLQVLRDGISHRLVQTTEAVGNGEYRTVSTLKPYFVYPWRIVSM